MGLEIINATGNARLNAPSVRLPASLTGARGFFAMGGDVAASGRNRVLGRQSERGVAVGAPVPNAGYTRFQHQVNFLQTPMDETAVFTVAGIFRAPAAFPTTADRPIFFGNQASGTGARGSLLLFQSYTETTMAILGSSVYDTGTGSTVFGNTQILNVPNPLGWKLVIWVVSTARRDLWNMTDNSTFGAGETRARLVDTTNKIRLGSAHTAANAGGASDICNLIYLPNVAASEAQRTDITTFLRADAALVGITA